MEKSRKDMCDGGNPILTSTIGEQGVRDFTICRTKEGIYYILATDLSLARNFKTKYKGSWGNVSRESSPNLVLWESPDLIHWSAPGPLPLSGRKTAAGACFLITMAPK